MRTTTALFLGYMYRKHGQAILIEMIDGFLKNYYEKHPDMTPRHQPVPADNPRYRRRSTRSTYTPGYNKYRNYSPYRAPINTIYTTYSVPFDEQNKNWRDNVEQNLEFVRIQEACLKDLLDARGHVFLNEVYDALGVKREPDGAIKGWLKDPDEDGAGIEFDINTDEYNNTMTIDFHVDGIIYDKI